MNKIFSEELTKEDWEKMLKESNQLLKECTINATVYYTTAKLARKMLKSFHEKKQLELLEKSQEI